MLFLDPIPQRMRGYSFIRETDLQSDGANISSVLFDLCREQEQKDRILDFVQALPEQDIRDIDFLETPRREVMVKLEESFGGESQWREAALLSDSTLRVLAVAAAVLSAPPGSWVVIEEIDNGVHPSRAETLLDNIQKAAKGRDLHVLLTTHSSALMDALSTEAIPDVVYCYRDPQLGVTLLLPIATILETGNHIDFHSPDTRTHVRPLTAITPSSNSSREGLAARWNPSPVTAKNSTCSNPSPFSSRRSSGQV